MIAPVDAAGRPLALCIAGPTATGKSAVALELSRRWPAEIISVDSAQVYRHMDIGTAKPDRATRQCVPHHLVDIREPWERYSAGEFRDDALALIRTIVAAGRVPILAGGTLLYFRALQQGLAKLPPANPAVRAAIDAEGEARGWDELHADLGRVDPQAAARIDRHDRQRIQRALEVYRLTGQPISRLQSVTAAPADIRFASFALLPDDRTWLQARIAERFHAMLAAGLVDELRRLRAMPGMAADVPAMRAVGYRQLWTCVDGGETEAEAVVRAITATRRYAKRQLTWLRSAAEFTPLSVAVDNTAGELADRIERELANRA